MNNFSAFITTGAFARFLATLFLFCVLLGAAVILSVEMVSSQALNPYAMALVGAGLSYSLTLLGIHLGNGNQIGATTA